MYNKNVSNAHLDIGPGTGWMLRRVNFPGSSSQVVGLVDLNENSLARSTQRLRRRGVEPTKHLGSVLRELPVDRQYSSVAASLLMHCVPGSWAEKGEAFRHIADATTDDGVFFGGTVLSKDVPHTRLSRGTLRWFNDAGGFHNAEDDLAGLRTALAAAWGEVELEVIGATALWTARVPLRR
ncbi:class I SAM-dependent methyltransferase [Nocardia callitridis]|uniref:Methyltransferase domain-containing protein n=1 Tax=Nocardia callitridis TaxID=648753 RepID=A0ABP9KGL6_9NOCA